MMLQSRIIYSATSPFSEPKISCRFSMRNLGINKIDNSQIISLPLYLVKDLKNILKDF